MAIEATGALLASAANTSVPMLSRFENTFESSLIKMDRIARTICGFGIRSAEFIYMRAAAWNTALAFAFERLLETHRSGWRNVPNRRY